ncbi:ribosome biogenesis GTPase YlqF [Acutalibacter sp. 1XD8-33]|uniref:ribosome biogenesis GTPase YlqF n=1 Tax=Acutalibacter sp. 1XD8-33 TaxID=2320081 RepID=UPI000EA12DDE|nr:ribosome biogenesis GTPase YlqF [Acutalibacter sp. 1XD8-33]RKJ40431.1 ribosome biogenesis GTPase YlqF [Acutalibacter sp. 1XD8-33]
MVQPVQWFPGHMAKTRRKIAEDLKLVDIVLELLDARIPISSSNPMLREIIQNKPRIVVLNKRDLADASQTAHWVVKYEQQGLNAVPVDSKTGKGFPALFSTIREELKDQIANWNKKGMTGRPIRIMVLGVPNVGKSSIINRMLLGGGAGKAEVRDKPGVTRRNRWFTVGKGFELLDTPGVLWPKFEDPVVGEYLAFTGAIRDEILDTEELAGRLLEVLAERYPQAIATRYKLVLPLSPAEGHRMLEQVARKRGMLLSGGMIDLERAAIMILDEFRGGKLGPLTLEWV